MKNYLNNSYLPLRVIFEKKSYREVLDKKLLRNFTRTDIFIVLLIGALFISSCQPEIKGDPERFKTGIFEAPAVEGSVSKTIITRNDSIQMEKYTKYTEISTDSGAFVREEERVDIYNIKWKNSFFYTLEMRNPKTDLDEDPIFVQITKVKENSYDFTAKIGYSKFKQNGTVTKVK